MTHFIITDSKEMELLEKGILTFCIQKAERPYLVGDTIIHQEIDGQGKLTGREVFSVINFLVGDECAGLKKDWCAFSIKEKENP